MTTATLISAETQIRQMIDEFSAAVRARDLDRMLAPYASRSSGRSIGSLSHQFRANLSATNEFSQPSRN